MFAAWRSFTRDQKFMERFGNSALQFSSSRRSQTKTDLPRRSQTKAGAFSIQPLAFVSAVGWENVAAIIGKFGGADHFCLTDSASPITEYDRWAEKSN